MTRCGCQVRSETLEWVTSFRWAPARSALQRPQHWALPVLIPQSHDITPLYWQPLTRQVTSSNLALYSLLPNPCLRLNKEWALSNSTPWFIRAGELGCGSIFLSVPSGDYTHFDSLCDFLLRHNNPGTSIRIYTSLNSTIFGCYGEWNPPPPSKPWPIEA